MSSALRRSLPLTSRLRGHRLGRPARRQPLRVATGKCSHRPASSTLDSTWHRPTLLQRRTSSAPRGPRGRRCRPGLHTWSAYRDDIYTQGRRRGFQLLRNGTIEHQLGEPKEGFALGDRRVRRFEPTRETWRPQWLPLCVHMHW